MKSVYLVFSTLTFSLLALFLFVLPSITYAQSCDCTVSVPRGDCGVEIVTNPDTGEKETIATCDNSSVTRTFHGYIAPGDPSTCEFNLEYSTCSLSGGNCNLSERTRLSTCPVPTPRPTATPPESTSPPGGDECWDNGGVCMTGANCGEFGLADTSYSCSDGQPLCCVPVSGGGGGGGGSGDECGEWDCSIDWTGVPSLMYVGLTYPSLAQIVDWDDKAHDQSVYKYRFDTENYFVIKYVEAPHDEYTVYTTHNARATVEPLRPTTKSHWLRVYANAYDQRGKCCGWHGYVYECESYTCDTATKWVQSKFPEPWYQIIGGNVTTNGDLKSQMPNCSAGIVVGSETVACEDKLILDGPGGYPGIATYANNIDVVDGSGTGTNGHVSSTDWNANTSFSAAIYDYKYFEDKIPDDVTVNDLPGVIPAVEVQSGGTTDSGGYTWFKRNGDLDILTPVVMPSGRKVVIFVDGDLYIQNRLVGADTLDSLFLVFVSGNIYVSPSVTTPIGTPAIEGIFFTDGNFNTGTDVAELHVKGAVVALGEIQMERNRGLVNPFQNLYGPSEYFEFAPEAFLNYPPDLIPNILSWKEVLPQ